MKFTLIFLSKVNLDFCTSSKAAKGVEKFKATDQSTDETNSEPFWPTCKKRHVCGRNPETHHQLRKTTRGEDEWS